MNDDDRDADERIADALERQNRLLEDQNAIIHEAVQTLLWAMYDVEGRNDPEARVPRLQAEDGLSNLKYINGFGRTDRHPEQERL